MLEWKKMSEKILLFRDLDKKHSLFSYFYLN